MNETISMPSAPPETPYAGFWLRAVALLLDAIVIWALQLAVNFVGMLIITPAMVGSGYVPDSSAIYTIYLISSLILPVYFIWLHGQFGQTLGKMAVGISVRDMQSNIIGYKQAFLRASPYLLIAAWAAVCIGIFTTTTEPSNTLRALITLTPLIVLLFMLVSAIVLAVNSKKRTLHDMIAKTMVIKTRV